MIKVKTTKKSRISQGDIICDVEHIEYVTEISGVIEVSKIVFPLIIVMTQDCDLAQDYLFRWSNAKTKSQDKYLISALVAPIYNLEHVYDGEHLSNLSMKMREFSRKKSATENKNLLQNETSRYHYLEFPPDIPIVSSVIDFKHYFSVNIEYLKKIKKTNFVCKVSELYRENISQRFASYLGRIGLP